MGNFNQKNKNIKFYTYAHVSKCTLVTAMLRVSVVHRGMSTFACSVGSGGAFPPLSFSNIGPYMLNPAYGLVPPA